MNGLSLLTADVRRAEKRGPKILIVGIPGVGKTSLLGTLRAGDAGRDPARRRRGGRPCCRRPADRLRSPAHLARDSRHRRGDRRRQCGAAGERRLLAGPFRRRRRQPRHGGADALFGRVHQLAHRYLAHLPGVGRVAAGERLRPRQKGPARNLRPRRARADRHAAADAARAREIRRLRQRAREGHRRLRRLTLGNPARRTTNRTRAARHRRRSHHHAFRRFRRRQAGPHFRVRPKRRPSRQGPVWTTRQLEEPHLGNSS